MQTDTEPTRKLPWWVTSVDHGPEHAVQAHTKGEARARVKRLLGVKRLPTGTRVERVG